MPNLFFDAYYLAPILTPFLVIGIITFVTEKRSAQVILLFSWMILPYVFLIGIPYQNIRFALIIFAPIALLTGVGMGRILTIKWSRKITVVIMRITLCIIVGIGLTQSIQANRMTINTFITNQESDKAIAHWLSDWVPIGSSLFTFGITLTVEHYNPSYTVYEIYYETPTTLRDQEFDTETNYLLLNVWQIENQWAGREPQAVYHWFRDERGLTSVARHGNYTLFRING